MLGLSATPDRKDGLSKVFYYFLGPQIVNIKRTSDKPEILFIKNLEEYPERLTRQGKANIPAMITDLTLCGTRNELIISLIKEYLLLNRKILLLSHRRSHCLFLNEKLRILGIDSGVYLGGMKMNDRNDNVKKSVILGTYQASGEGFDVPELDTLILSTPRSDVEQAVGRILRQKNTNTPLVIDITDNGSIFKGQYYLRRKFYTISNFGILK
jgi:superfamily II DNA or RNA helicase